jgi:hypothetical protein
MAECVSCPKASCDCADGVQTSAEVFWLRAKISKMDLRRAKEGGAICQEIRISMKKIRGSDEGMR